MNHEQWRPCPDAEGQYEVSDHGRVRRSAHGGAAKVGKVLAITLVNGYPGVTLWHNGKAIARKVHVLVARAFLKQEGAGKPGTAITHLDGNRENNHFSNLCVTTQSTIRRHAVNVLDQNHGEQVGTAKLTIEDVNTIRLRIKNGDTLRAIAEDYGVSHSTISNIKNNKAWRHD